MAGNFKYFENGFIAISGKQIMRVTDVNISYKVSTDEVTSFDSNFVKEFQPTFSEWTATATLFLNDTTTSGVTDSNITGATNALLIYETIKARTPVNLVLKVDSSNFQKGSVILTGGDISGAVGGKMTMSLSMQGSGALTKASS